MKYYCGLLFALILLFTSLFLLAEQFNIALLTDPTPWMQRNAWWAAGLGLGLLIADVFLPIPASLIMITHGAVFGIIFGTLINLIGGTLATLVGFWAGRRGGKWLERAIPEDARREADQLIARHGFWIVIVTRPVPLLAESVAVVAGTTHLRWWSMVWASIAGLLPAAALYALTGATTTQLANAYWVFGLVLCIAAVTWFAGRKRPTKMATELN